MDPARLHLVNDLTSIFFDALCDGKPTVAYPASLLSKLSSASSTHSPMTMLGSLKSMGRHIFTGGLSLSLLSTDYLAPVHTQHLLTKLHQVAQAPDTLQVLTQKLLSFHAQDPVELFYEMIGLMYVERGCDFVFKWIKHLLKPALCDLDRYVDSLALKHRRHPAAEILPIDPKGTQVPSIQTELEMFWLTKCPSTGGEVAMDRPAHYSLRHRQHRLEYIRKSKRNYQPSDDYTKRRRLF